MKALKTHNALLLLDSQAEQQITVVNKALVRLWNILKWIIDHRLVQQKMVKDSFRQALQDEPHRKDELQQLRNNQLKPLGINAIALTYVIPRINAHLKKRGYILTSDLVRELARKLAGSYESFFKLKKNKDTHARIPRRKSYKTGSVVLSWPRIKIQGSTLELSMPNRTRLSFEIPQNLLNRIGNQKIIYITLTKIPHDKRWKCGIVVSYEAPDPNIIPTRIRTIDLGAGNIAVSDSDGAEFLIPTRRSEKHWREQIKTLDTRIKGCTKGSRSYTRRTQARRIMHGKSGNQHKDHQRKLAQAICKGVDMIVIGKPRTRLGLARSKKGTADQHHGVQNTGYMSRLMIFIKEKCAEFGVQYLEVEDPSRQGTVRNPDTKFEATRTMLLQILHEQHLPIPTGFTQKQFKFNQGGKKKKEVQASV